jgi:hypothetical protein
MYNTSMPSGKWGQIIAQSRLLLQREQQYKQQMAAMRRRLAFISAHQDELPQADMREAAELQGQLQAVGLEYANWMQANLAALEAASRTGIRL